MGDKSPESVCLLSAVVCLSVLTGIELCNWWTKFKTDCSVIIAYLNLLCLLGSGQPADCKSQEWVCWLFRGVSIRMYFMIQPTRPLNDHGMRNVQGVYAFTPWADECICGKFFFISSDYSLYIVSYVLGSPCPSKKWIKCTVCFFLTGPHTCRCPEPRVGLLETPPGWHATIYFFCLDAISMGTVRLALDHNRISEVDNLAFRNCMDSLIWLNMDSNLLQGVPNDIKYLKNLRVRLSLIFCCVNRSIIYGWGPDANRGA